MNLSGIFYSQLGMFVTQSIFHSLIAAIIIRRSLRIWSVEGPLSRQRYLNILMAVPIISYPLYQVLDPVRGTASFRIIALFDSHRWLMMEAFGIVPVYALFGAMLIFFTGIFAVQELIPIIRHLRTSGSKDNDLKKISLSRYFKDDAESTGTRGIALYTFDDDEPFIYSSTGRDPAIYLSSGSIRAHNDDQIRAAIAHELAHIDRSKRPMMILMFVLRAIMFYNPVILFIFRKIVQEEEKICDDMAVSMTGDHVPLAQILREQFNKEAYNKEASFGVSRVKESAIEYSHTLHLNERINRLDNSKIEPDRWDYWVKLIVTLMVIGVINYYVV